MSLLSRNLSHLPLLFISCCAFASAGTGDGVAGSGLKITLSGSDGSFTIGARDLANPVLKAGAAADVNGKWIGASEYPEHYVDKASGKGELGHATDWTLRYSGRADAPELDVRIRVYADSPFGEAYVTLRNTTGHAIEVQAIRVFDAKGEGLLDLGGPAAMDRVLSDSFSEDRPAIQIRDLTHAENQLHRGVGSQLVYNLQSKKSWFVGALTSDKFLSVLRLHMTRGEGSAQTSSYEVESTGTTELLAENSLRDSPSEDRMQLALPLESGAQISSERMLFGIGDDYHEQLETYGRLIRELHHARVTAPTPLGWWSWTAYYFGLNEGTALTNAQWLSQHLKPLGYNFFHMDEGYQFARGEYSTPDAAMFPHGLATVEHNVVAEGLTPGIWTAPFEVSERSWIFTHHPEWLVRNARNKPIHLGTVTEGRDRIFALDATNPDAQAYLRATYSKLVNEWGIRYIKLDFMEDSAVEGIYYQPHVTALEAQRVGLKVIRDAVGDSVLLDKDGCELLNLVGIVDVGRISQDTGHTFSSSKDAASGIAARYYMNRNYFLADPDAFGVSKQTVDDQSWHGGSVPLTLDEAKVSIALSAVSGGLFEIGDDLPTVGESPEREALLENRELLDMARLGRSSIPVDLMNYQTEDLQPSLFLLKEDDRQSILTIFNWTEKPRAHQVSLATLGLTGEPAYTVTEVLSHPVASRNVTGSFDVIQPPHSVRIFKLIKTGSPARQPVAKALIPSSGVAGETLDFSACPLTPGDAIVHYGWDFGDGVTSEGSAAKHSYTHSGAFHVKLSLTGLGGTIGESSAEVSVTGSVSTKYAPEEKRRYESKVP